MSKHLQTVAAMACMKSLLMIFNFIFWVTGIAILAIGVYMEVKLHKYMEMSSETAHYVLIGSEFSETAPYVLIGTGSLIILMGTLACCCTLKGQPVLLYVYGAFLAIVFVMELGAGISIFTYRNKLAEGFNNGLTQAMRNYKNDTSHLAINFDQMQETLHCCGNHRPRDWLDLTPSQPIPSSCCIKPGCDTDNEQDIFSQGCFTKVVEFLGGNIGIVAGCAVGVAFFPLIGIFLSCCLANLINKTKYEQMA